MFNQWFREMDITSSHLSEEYRLRFAKIALYRKKVWRILINNYFQDLVGFDQVVVDVGCGWGEFINGIRARDKYAIDLNPDAKTHLLEEIRFLHQSCAEPWPLADSSIDVVFTSNFLEHLPTKNDLLQTMAQAHRCLKPGGLIICIGPNLKYTGGAYWDFFDHHLPLTEASISEALQLSGFQVTTCVPKFLPYTMSDGKQPPLWTVSVYLKLPLAWKLFGKQFLVIARRN